MASTGPLFLYGVHPVRVALEKHPDRFIALYIQDNRSGAAAQSIQSLARKHHIPVQRLPKKNLEKWVGGNVAHQGIVAKIKPMAARSEHDLMQRLDQLEEPPFLLLLDNLQDPHNLGACLRSADAAGIHAVIAPKDRAVGLTPAVHKTAAGATETVPFFSVTNLVRVMSQLQDRGIWLVGADAQAEHTLYDIDLTGPIAMVMGAEHQGLRRLTKQHCDYLCRIPMAGTVSSLNVSVATGIFLFEACRQRG